ncbi:DMT family transporter [Jannaschia sp. W003]|uniref:DMT family transporter n=1 Tax=Jannaschia sp. W003 TaxID=2867012 RepID=UPI0021A8B6A3|nr:DMT family transporter [Jannaschia sp. W003]UWQ22985.1 DMT family transporter [Jannaschia sp. W003]
MLLFSALVAGSFPLGAAAADHIAPTALNAARFALASLIVGAGVWATGGAPRAAWAAPWRYALLGGVFGLYFVLMFEGLKTAAPVSAAAVFTLTPPMAAGFGWLLLRQRTTPRIALALALGAAGALWVIFDADVAALRRFEVGRGEWVYFWGCAAHALYTPMVRRLNRGERAAVFTFGTLVAGTALISLVGLPAILRTDWGALPGVVWVAIGYTGVFASAATFTLLQYASLRLPSAKVMAYTFLVPAWVAVWSVALGEPAPPVAMLAGVALTVGALGLLLKTETPRT